MLHAEEVDDYFPNPRQRFAMLHNQMRFDGHKALSDFSIFPSPENPVVMINDAYDRSGNADEIQSDANCSYLHARVNSLPYVFVIALRRIEAGEALTVDYGEEFWEHRVDFVEAAFEQSWEALCLAVRNVAIILEHRITMARNLREAADNGSAPTVRKEKEGRRYWH